MEPVLILAAVLACAIAGVAVGAMSARGRRPPMRLDSEFDLDDANLLAKVGPPASPIDRSADILEAETVEPASPRQPRERT